MPESRGSRPVSEPSTDEPLVRHATGMLHAERASRWEAMMALSDMGVWEVQSSLTWSRTTARLHGFPEDAPPPALYVWLERMTASDRETMIGAVLGGCRERGRPITYAYEWPVDGQVRYLRGQCVAELGADGSFTRLVGTIQDVTSDTLARMALAKATAESAAASRLKSQFLANMSHEIRTPMNGVLGMTSLLLDTDLTTEQRNYAVAAKASGDSLLALINDILDLSKIEAGKLVIEERTIDVREIVRVVAAELGRKARDKGIAFVVDVDDSVPSMSAGDALRIRQVLTNLVSNAIKFTARGEVDARFWQDDDLLRFTVRDTGIGIAPEALHLIFEAFCQADGATTRKFGGTGLGLSIARELVERMGGDLTVQSTLGKGSTFEVSIHAPGQDSGRFASTLAPADCTSAGFNPAPRRMHVLVAEDDDTNALLTNALLGKLGHTVVRSRNGTEAVAAASFEPFDCIFMDVQMPGLDGFEATARIRAREKKTGGHVPICALTANAMKGDAELCVQAGMDGYLSKPIGIGPLRDMLARWGGGQ